MGAMDQEQTWIKHALSLFQKESLSSGDTRTWSAFHASQIHYVADNPAMVKHGMYVQRQATQFLNPGQI